MIQISDGDFFPLYTYVLKINYEIIMTGEEKRFNKNEVANKIITYYSTIKYHWFLVFAVEQLILKNSSLCPYYVFQRPRYPIFR